MAVYTEVSAESLADFLVRYDVGELRSAKGIAEGVSNSNFLVETSRSRFILTLYETRTTRADLPFFLALMTHFADAGLPVPRPIRDRRGEALQTLAGRAACLIEFLPGVSVSTPTAAQAGAAGEALARLHLAGRDFPRTRVNRLSLPWWQATAADLGDRLDEIAPQLQAMLSATLADLAADWPSDLPAGTVHADLFPDNVLMLGNRITGLIDFYFACTDFFAYDLMVLHAAWGFSADGSTRIADNSAALFAGYEAIRPLRAAERAALPLIGQGAALRFLLSRAQDWLAPASAALVMRKDPMPFVRRLHHYRAGDV